MAVPLKAGRSADENASVPHAKGGGVNRDHMGLLAFSLSAMIATASAAEEPMADRLRAYYPAQAIAAGLDGAATLSCTVTPQRAFKNCRLVSEEPTGMGFGEAALRLAAASRPNPKAPTPARRNEPVAFHFGLTPMTITPNTLEPIVIVRNPTWVRLATPQELRGAFPAEAISSTGQAAVKCHVAVDQTLIDCSVVQESPEGQGFGRAALDLAKVFRMTPKTYDGEPQGGHPVIIPIDFTR